MSRHVGRMDHVAEPDIAGAIRRSRDIRAAMRSRRRHGIAITVGIAAALIGAGVFSVGGLNGSDVVQAAVSQAKSLAELLDQRSPGKRTQGELTKTKHARVLAKRRMAAAPKVHQPPAAPQKVNMPDIAQLLASPPPLAPVSLAQPLPLTEISSPPPLAAIIAPPPGGGGVVSPPGSGGGPVTFPTELPREPVTPPSAVPEPATWAMMLLGFGLIGWRVRTVRRRPSPKRSRMRKRDSHRCFTEISTLEGISAKSGA